MQTAPPLTGTPPLAEGTHPLGLAGERAPTARARTRLTDLDRAKGLAILLVVFGHLVPDADPQGLTWYDPLRIAIYLFHMPFFMYLSGYVTFWSKAADTPPGRWATLIQRRASRLLVPFFGFGLAILLAKLVAVHLMHVDNVPQGLLPGLDSLFVHTAHSPATSVWYIGCLFVYVIATPPLLRLPGLRRLGAWGPEITLLAIALLLYVIQAPAIVYMDRVCRFFIFFVIGGLAARGGDRWWRLIDRLWMPALVVLIAFLGWASYGGIQFDWGADAADHLPYKACMLLAGVLSMVALHGLCRNATVARQAWLVFVGNMCFAIYLLNTICLGLTKGIMLKFFQWNAQDFPIVASTMMLAGVFGPILIKRYVLCWIPPLDRITD